MKITVTSQGGINSLRCHAMRTVAGQQFVSENPTHYVIFPIEVPINTKGNFVGAWFKSVKALKEEASWYGGKVVKEEGNA